MTRPYRDDKHLWSTIETEAGAIAVHPIRADRIMFDIAKTNHAPAHRPDGQHGSRVLSIGNGVEIRAGGFVTRTADGWTVERELFDAIQYPSGRELTTAQDERARELITSMVLGWIATHEGDIAQAEDIYRNNAALALEENVAKHVEALRILRRNLRACENGRTYTQYPDLPTKGR